MSGSRPRINHAKSSYRNGQTTRRCRCPFPSLLGVIFLEMCVCDVEWLFCAPRPLPDSESSFLFQILKLMEGRWTRAPSAMPAGRAGRRVTRAFSSTSDGGGGGRCDRPSQYLLLTAFRYMERRRRREERGRGAKSKRPSCLLLLSPLISSASSVCIRAGRWAVRPRWLHRTRKRGRATFDLEENSFRFCPGDQAANLICRTLWADVVAEADSHGARSSRARRARQKPKS